MDLEITKTPLIVLSKDGQSTIEVPSAPNGSLLLENGNRLLLESGSGVLITEDDGTITPTGIASGTLSLKRSIVDTDIDFGTPIASEFSVELFNIETDLQGYTIQVYLKDTQTSALTPIFTGVVDSSKTDNVGHTRQIVAYDWIYYHRNDNVADWWNSLPRTIYDIKTIRNSLLRYLGFTIPSAEYVNDYAGGMSWTENDFPTMTTITVAQVLKMLCELQGTFPYIDATGNLTFAILDNDTTTDLRGEYESYNSTWEDFVTEPITGIASYSSSDDLLMLVGTDDNAYSMAGNLWFIYLNEYDYSAAQEVLEDLLEVIETIQYKPCQLKMIKAHNGLVLGQRVQTDKGYTYVMSEELSGVCFVEQTIEGKASASTLSGEVSDINDTLVQGHKMSRVEKTIDGISTQVSNVETNLQNNYYTKTATETRLQQTSAQIVTYVGETVTEEGNEIRSEVSSQIQQLSNKIVLKVDNNGKIVKVALGADASAGSTFSIDADYISFVANKTLDLVTGNIAVSANNFSIDNSGNVTLTGTIHANAGDIGGWTIRSSGLGYGMTSPSDYDHNGIFLNGSALICNNYSSDYRSEISSGSLIVKSHNTDLVKVTSSAGGYQGWIQLDGRNSSVYTVIVNDSININGSSSSSDDSVGLYVANNGIRRVSNAFKDTKWTINRVICSNSYSELISSDISISTLNCLSGVTFNIQDQLNGKQATITGGATTIVSNNLTASKALVSNANGKVAVSPVTATELGYVSGATSNIQGQIDDVNADIDTTLVEVSGNPITITDAANIPCESLTMTIEPIQSGSGTPSIDNVRPISGLTEAKVNDGINVWDGNSSYTINTDGYLFARGIPVSQGKSYEFIFDCADPKQQYAFEVFKNSTATSNRIVYEAFYVSEKNKVTFTISESATTYIGRLYTNSPNGLTVSNIVLNEIANSATITFGETVYGGNVDFKSGIVTVNRAKHTFVWGTYTYQNIRTYVTARIVGKLNDATGSSWSINLCDKLPEIEQWDLNGPHFYIDSSNKNVVAFFVNGTSDETTFDICYELAEPRTITLTPAQLTLLKGNNTVSGNGATISLSYQKDNVVGDIKQWTLDEIAELPKANIYGVEWDGSSTSKWTRTDSSKYYPEPQSAVNNGNGFSPFDMCYPWAGMVRIEDADAGTLVSIPKFWYKWTRNGSSMKLQIADAPIDGFLVSPAHADRGDGKGERDVVYVGAYHCAVLTYKSTTDVAVQRNETRASFRTNIHNLGSDIWQWDYAMLWTIRMLYLVEYADWDSQEKIGYGCGNNTAPQSNGFTDDMIYHTGTNVATRQTYGHVKYRGIEGLWDNVQDWVDGIYFNNLNAYGIINPSEFSDSDGGTYIGTVPSTPSTGGREIASWTNPSVSGFEYALLPATLLQNVNYNTYTCDGWYANSSGQTMAACGIYAQGKEHGLFEESADTTSSTARAFTGSRLMILP